MLKRSFQLYTMLCEKLRKARLLYRLVAEPRMGHSPRREREVLFAMSEKLSAYSDKYVMLFEELYQRINGKRVCVVGPLTNDVGNECVGSNDTVILVDRSPDFILDDLIIVGDFDGLYNMDLYGVCGSSSSSICLLHVHGDNYGKLAGFFGSQNMLNAVFTSQIDCRWPVLGVGGYTDGDRAVLLAMALGAKEIRVAGFNFSKPYCGHKRYGCYGYFLEVKSMKLRIAELMVKSGALVYGYTVSLENIFHSI